MTSKFACKDNSVYASWVWDVASVDMKAYGLLKCAELTRGALPRQPPKNRKKRLI